MDTATALRVREYIDHLNDPPYIQQVFTLAGVDGVARVLLAMLRSRDADDVIAAHLFLRDVVNYRVVPAFTVHLPTSGIVEALRANLYVPDFAIRRDTIFTIGKIGPRANASLLAEAFPVYLRRDPLLLPGLVGELFWLTRHARQWAYLRAVAASPHYLVRWSLLDGLAIPPLGVARHDKYERRRYECLLDLLAGDPHPLVRAEASYQRRALPTRKEERQWRHGDRRALWQRLGQGEPELTFTTVEMLFSNYLAVLERTDYDLETLDAFVRYRQEHPIPRRAPEADDEHEEARFDMPAYVCAFDAWLRGRD